MFRSPSPNARQRRTLAASSPAEAAATFARMVTSVLERAGRLIQVADAAAQQDAELVPLWIAGHKGRLANMGQLAKSFATAGYLRDGVEPDTAAELLWVITSPDTYRSFTVILGWSTIRYERWIRSTVEDTFPLTSRHSARSQAAHDPAAQPRFAHHSSRSRFQQPSCPGGGGLGYREPGSPGRSSEDVRRMAPHG